MTRHRFILSAAALFVLLGSFLPLSMVVGETEDKDGPLVFDTPPEVIKTVAPEYPKSEREQGIEGKVVIRVTIDTKGVVVKTVVEKGIEDHPAFGEAAEKAATQWEFKPAKQGDDPVKCQILIPFLFKLK